MQRNFTNYDLPAGAIAKAGLPAQMANVIWKMMKISTVQVTLAMIFTGMVMANDNYVLKVLDREVYLKVKEVNFKKVLREIVLTPETETTASIKESSDTDTDDFVAITVTGKITDSNGITIPGVSILVKGTNTGTVTDAEGNYSISVPDTDAVLIFSSIGYITQEIAVNGRTVIDVILAEDVRSLDEIVVVGYGSVKKSDLTGSVSKIEADKISKSPLPNVDQALQGQASGVFVTSVDGSPGAQSTIRIRGGKSINAGNEPLFVVDGFISDRSIVTALNPEDIQSIDVLKDASAAAIYGARGSNGVILVTTKRGIEGQTEVTFSTSYGVQQIARKAEMLNAQEYIDFANQGEVFLGNPPGFSDEDRQRIGEGTDWKPSPNPTYFTG